MFLEISFSFSLRTGSFKIVRLSSGVNLNNVGESVSIYGSVLLLFGGQQVIAREVTSLATYWLYCIVAAATAVVAAAGVGWADEAVRCDARV